MQSPLVSAIIPVYNGACYVAQAIESVRQQTYAPVEIIVVDDGSTDESSAIVQAFAEVRLIRQENAGVGAARNTGIAAARGEFLAFLDQDDRWLPEKLTTQIAYHLAHPHLGYTYTGQQFFLEEGFARPSWVRPEWLTTPQPGQIPSTLVVRPWAFAQIGLFDPMYLTGSDSDWAFRAKDAGIPMAILPDLLMLRRVHSENGSAATATLARELLSAARQSVLRQRQQRQATRQEGA